MFDTKYETLFHTKHMDVLVKMEALKYSHTATPPNGLFNLFCVQQYFQLHLLFH